MHGAERVPGQAREVRKTRACKAAARGEAGEAGGRGQEARVDEVTKTGKGQVRNPLAVRDG